MLSSAAFATLLAGLGFGFSLIVAIGAQNAFVLRQGLRREHLWVVVVLCAASDMVLIAAGVGGLGSALQAAPGAVEVVRWLGAVVVLAYGALAARRAWTGTSGLDAAAEPATGPALPDGGGARGDGAVAVAPAPARTRLAAVVATTLALTWLNPHVYLDTLVLMGGVGSTYGDLRWWFAGGAVVASWAWFTGLAHGARLLAPALRRPGAWRVVDGVIAVIMLAVAVGLVAGA